MRGLSPGRCMLRAEAARARARREGSGKQNSIGRRVGAPRKPFEGCHLGARSGKPGPINFVTMYQSENGQVSCIGCTHLLTYIGCEWGEG